jgi:hypothetical protein
MRKIKRRKKKKKKKKKDKMVMRTTIQKFLFKFSVAN